MSVELVLLEALIQCPSIPHTAAPSVCVVILVQEGEVPEPVLTDLVQSSGSPLLTTPVNLFIHPLVNPVPVSA